MDKIEKARNAGDVHPNGKWVWTEYKPGKYDWRPNKGGAAATSSRGSGDTAKPAKTATSSSKSTSKPMNSQQLITWAADTDDAVLAKVANNTKGNAQLRKIAYDALEKRGYDVSSIDTSGTLQQMLKLTGSKNGVPATSQGDDDVAPTNSKSSVDIDDDDDEGGDEGGEITEKWYLDKNDSRVKAKFNLKTKEGRIKYDQFVYKMKKKEPDYKNPVEVVQDLNEQYLEFLDNDEQRFMISAGGAGIGKSYGFNKMAELLNLKPFEEGDSPGDGDYDIFEAPDVNSGKQLLSILKAHNDKIIVFDDNDKVLRRADCASVMKKATATTGRRIVGDPDDVKSNFEYTGRIMVMTNKDLAVLSESEDTKAIISRAMMVSEIYMTVPETIEVMESRFQDYEFKQAPRLDDEKEDKKEREEIMNLIKKNQRNIDPSQFTTRTFQEILINKRKVDKANEKRKNPAFASLIGDKDKSWKDVALGVLTKADMNDFVEGDSELFAAEELILKGEPEDDGVNYDQDNEELDEFSKAESLLLGEDYGYFEKAEFSEKERKKLSKEKEAMPDGSYPIRNASDLKNAIQAFGRAKNPSKTKAWIKKRAKQLDKENLLPDTWKADIHNDLDFGDDMDLRKAERILGLGSGIMG